MEPGISEQQFPDSIFVAVVSCVVSLAMLGFCEILIGVARPPALAKLSDDKLRYFNSCIPSTIHAIVVFSLAFYSLIFESQLRADPCWGNSIYALTACAITVGYMFGDSIYMLLNWKSVGDWSYVFHHSITVAAYLCVLNKGCFQYLAMIRLLAELSTPCVNARALLFEVGLKDSVYYYKNGLFMLGSFTASRIIPLPYYMYLIYSITGTDPFIQTGAGQFLVYISTIVLDTLNIMWFHKMIKGAIKVWTLHHSKEDKIQNGVKIH